MAYRFVAAVLLMLVSCAAALSQEAGWPRRIEKQGGTLVYYQPQVDAWQEFSEITWRMAFSLTPAGAAQLLGVVEMRGRTNIDNDVKMVLISNLTVLRASFPSLDPARAAASEQLLKTFLPQSVLVSLHEVVASAEKPRTVTGVVLNNDPPLIIASYRPAILLAVEGDPVLAKIPNTSLQFVVNTTWPLFLDGRKSSYYLLVAKQWLTAQSLAGPWSATTRLPKDMTKLREDPQWADLKAVIPPAAIPSGANPAVFYSSRPAEILLFDGSPVYSARIPGTQLVYATNTASYLFVHASTQQYYFLAGGRWFRAKTLQGPWSFASMDLPADFARIPADNPASIVLASVPGTQEARDAVLLAQVPTTMAVDPAAAAAVKVTYGGDPNFAPISGTTMYYATNTQEKVIKVGDVYYLCLQGVWFLSTTPQGPWTVATSIPQVIYTIPPSSPVYNVTYVTQVTEVDGDVESSYTAGYLGAFVVGTGVGAIVADGSGYYYPPYIYWPAYGYPVYYPYPYGYGFYGSYGSVAHYNSATGAYGVSRGVWGPYGSATRGAAYNPYTGTAARGATVATPYGSRSAVRTYNPYTGTYAATRQGSSPTAQWGRSVTTNGSNVAYSRHYSDARGSVGSVQTASGAGIAGASTARGNTVMGKTASGDLYAGRDGNVYKNTGSGWQTYDNGNWSSLNGPAQQPALNTSRQPPADSVERSGRVSEQMQDLQQESRSRARGAQQSTRFQQSGRRSFGGRRGR